MLSLLNIVPFQDAIAEAGGIKALVDLIFKWPSSTDELLVCILNCSFLHIFVILLEINCEPFLNDRNVQLEH